MAPAPAAVGPCGEQQRVVPAVAELVLGRAGRALHGERAELPQIAAASSSDSIDLAVPGFADEQQAALAGEGHDAALDQRPVADELGVDLQ